MRPFIRALTIVAVVVAAICCTEPKKAKAAANDPVLGGCIICLEKEADGKTCKVCKLSAHPSVVQALSAVDLKTSTLMYGVQAVNPGVCYGVTYQPGEWYASGANFCLNAAHTERDGNVVFPSGVLQLLKWGEVGIGSYCAESFSSARDKLICHALLMFGANVPIE